VWHDDIQRDPTGWLESELGDLHGLLERGGVDVAGASWLEADAAAVRAAVPVVVAAVEAAWKEARRGQ